MNCEFCGGNYGIIELRNGRIICGSCLFFGTGETVNTFPGLLPMIEAHEAEREDKERFKKL